MIPAKLMRDWKTLFLVGKSLCGDSSEGSSDGVIGVGGGEESVSGGSSDDIRDCDEILNDVDIQEYLVRTYVHVYFTSLSIENDK